MDYILDDIMRAHVGWVGERLIPQGFSETRSEYPMRAMGAPKGQAVSDACPGVPYATFFKVTGDQFQFISLFPDSDPHRLRAVQISASASEVATRAVPAARPVQTKIRLPDLTLYTLGENQKPTAAEPTQRRVRAGILEAKTL